VLIRERYAGRNCYRETLVLPTCEKSLALAGPERETCVAP
ncbi:uncharacterized protein METZ01_LOCUS107754, partial [marine metagenome]